MFGGAKLTAITIDGCEPVPARGVRTVGCITCADGNVMRNKRWVKLIGLVLVRQKPGSAKGVMFIAVEDETGVANLFVWPQAFDANRRTVLIASMLGIEGHVQREGEVVQFVVRKLIDLSGMLANVGDRGAPFPLLHGHGDEFHHSGSPD